MTKLNKDSLEFYIFEKTGGLHDPLLVKKFIGLLQEWLPSVEKGEILENLWRKKND